MTSELLDRVPPQSLEAEQAVLGAMLLERDAAQLVRVKLHETDFYRDANRLLFRELSAMNAYGIPLDPVEVCERLKNKPATVASCEDMLQQIGGTLYLTSCMDACYVAANVERYCKIVRAKSLQRALIKHADAIIGQAHDVEEAGIEEMLRAAESQMMQLSDWWVGDDAPDMVTWAEAEMQAIQARREADNLRHDAGHRSPLARLNRMLMPIRPGDFTIIAGRPSTGKTSLAVQWAYHLAATEQRKGLFISIEMTKDALAMRRLRAATGYSRWHTDTLEFRTGGMGEAMYAEMDAAVRASQDIPLLLMDVPVITPDQLLDAGRRARRRLGGLDFIAIDYIQKMNADERIVEDTPRVGAVCRGVKRAAMRLKCNVLGLSQINREGGKQRPTMGDLRDSGWLEQEADQIILLHFPDRSNKREIEIGLEKQRDGGTGWELCGFDERTTWFYDTPNDVPVREGSTYA